MTRRRDGQPVRRALLDVALAQRNTGFRRGGRSGQEQAEVDAGFARLHSLFVEQQACFVVPVVRCSDGSVRGPCSAAPSRM